MARKEGILGDEEAQAAKRKSERAEKDQRRSDMQWLLAQPQGRRWFYRHIYETCGVENGIWESSAAIHYREGRRSVGIEVKNEAQRVSPHNYMTMIQEQLIEAQLRADKESTDE